MVVKSDCYYLGKITKALGLDGWLQLYLDTTNPEEYNKLELVFVDIHNELTPFFITEIQLQSQQKARVRFEDITHIDQVSHLINCELYLPLSSLKPLKGKAFYYHEVEGFEVVDLKYGKIGSLVKVLDLPANPLLEVDANGIEVLIPKNDETIVSVDRKSKVLQVACPEGLLDLYLGGNE